MDSGVEGYILRGEVELRVEGAITSELAGPYKGKEG